MSKFLSEDIFLPRTFLFIGPAGCAKSTFAYRFPKPWVANVDINMSGPKKVLTEEGRPLTVAYDNIHLDDLDKPVDPLKQYLRFTEVLSKAVQSPDYETIIIDSITSLVPVFKNEVLRSLNKPIGTQFEIKDWGKLLFLFTDMFTKLRACGKTVIVIGHFDVEKGEVDQVLRYTLAIPGQSAGLMPILATDMFWFAVETIIVNGDPKPKYVIRTIQDERHPNIKTSLKLPPKFDANQQWVDEIVKQIKPSVPATT